MKYLLVLLFIAGCTNSTDIEKPTGCTVSIVCNYNQQTAQDIAKDCVKTRECPGKTKEVIK